MLSFTEIQIFFVREELKQMRLNTEKLRATAYKKSINQTALAEATGITRITINGVFNGKSCNDETARKIAECLGVELKEIQAK